MRYAPSLSSDPWISSNREGVSEKITKHEMILRENASLQSLFFIFLVKLLQKQPSHRNDIVSVAFVAAPPWPYRQRIMSWSVIPFPTNGTLPSVVRSFPFFHISPS